MQNGPRTKFRLVVGSSPNIQFQLEVVHPTSQFYLQFQQSFQLEVGVHPFLLVPWLSGSLFLHPLRLSHMACLESGAERAANLSRQRHFGLGLPNLPEVAQHLLVVVSFVAPYRSGSDTLAELIELRLVV